MGPTVCPQTSVRIYHHNLHNIPEERRSYPFSGENLKALKEHETLDLNCALNHTKIKNPVTDSSLTIFLKTILHSVNFQNVLNNKELCAKQRFLTHIASG